MQSKPEIAIPPAPYRLKHDLLTNYERIRSAIAARTNRKRVLCPSIMDPAKPRKLLEQVSDLMRVKHYSYRTEQTYIQWIRRYILFHNKRHPLEMGEAEVEAFLTHLAVHKNVAASTQNQALCALIFF